MILRPAIMATAAVAPPVLFSRLYDVAPYQRLLLDWIAGLGLAPDAALLEVGCGPGRLCHDLSKTGYQVWGADRSARMIRAARRNGLEAARTVTADALDLPFAAGRFDAVVSASLINVVGDAPGLLAELVRVTRPAGTVSCLFPAPRLRDLDPRAEETFSTLGLVDRELVTTWARLSLKLEAETVCDWMRASGLRDLTVQSFWGGRLLSVAGKT